MKVRVWPNPFNSSRQLLILFNSINKGVWLIIIPRILLKKLKDKNIYCVNYKKALKKSEIT